MQDPTTQNGGSSANANAQANTRTSQEVNQEYIDAKARLDDQIRLLDAPTVIALNKKLKDANESLAKFSHGSLIKHMEEQHKQLQADLTTRANILDENQKKNFSDAVQNFLTVRLELARVRLDEYNQKDPQTQEAGDKISQHQFRDPSGKTDQNLLSKLGSGHSHIQRTEQGLLFASTVTVSYEGGVLSSESPKDLAMTAKAMGWNEFEFSMGSTKNGGKILKDSIREMLKIGIKDITLSKELREQMYGARRAGNFQDALIENMHTLSKFAKEELEQLERICAASSGAFNQQQHNPVFNDQGGLKTDPNPKALTHQVDTFMRLTDETHRLALLDSDRLAYLEILFTEDKPKHYAEFTTELEKRNVKFNVDGKELSPVEYFNQYMLRIGRKGAYNTEIDQQKKLATFNDATKTTLDQCKDTYLATDDAKLLVHFAQSARLDSANNDHRIALVKAVFDDVQSGEHKIALYEHPVTVLRYVTSEDRKRFLDKTLPLFSAMKVVSGQQNEVDYLQTATAKSQLLTDLRSEAAGRYTREKDIDEPAAFNNFYKNKLLLDELETKMLDDHYQKHGVPKAYKEAGRQLEAQPNLTKEQKDALVNQCTENEYRALYVQHAQTYRATPRAEQANHFVNHLSPDFQMMLWPKSNPLSAETVALRAEILKKYIDIYSKENTPAALDFLKNSVTPLLANMDNTAVLAHLDNNTEMSALTKKLAALCQADNMHGCSLTQNRALKAIREIVTAQGSASAAEPLLTANLFKEHYNKAQNTANPANVGANNNNIPQLTPAAQADKLQARLDCYASVKPAHFFANHLLNQKFDAEMQALLFGENSDKAQTKAVLELLKLKPGIDEKTKVYIKRIEALQTQHSAPAVSPEHSNSNSDTEMDDQSSANEANSGAEMLV